MIDAGNLSRSSYHCFTQYFVVFCSWNQWRSEGGVSQVDFLQTREQEWFFKRCGRLIFL